MVSNISHEVKIQQYKVAYLLLRTAHLSSEAFRFDKDKYEYE